MQTTTSSSCPVAHSICPTQIQNPLSTTETTQNASKETCVHDCKRERESTRSAVAGCKAISIVTISCHFRKAFGITYTCPFAITTSIIYNKNKGNLASSLRENSSQQKCSKYIQEKGMVTVKREEYLIS